jgi:hypothetical protein
MIFAAAAAAADAMMTMMQPQRTKTIYYYFHAVYFSGSAACHYQCPVDPSIVEKCSTDSAAAVGHVEAPSLRRMRVRISVWICSLPFLCMILI